MRFFVDTNVLLYAANLDAPEHAAAAGFLRRTTAAGEDWALSWGVIYEFIRVSTHPRVMRPALSLAEALAFLRPFLALQNVTVLGPTPRHFEMLERTAAEHPRVAGNLVFDLRTAVLLREHGLQDIVTADTDFLQFPFLRVTNPLLE